jgi:CDP-diacylglycerol---glycerol-3-phosphate 3-phosphatidyltransferase
LSEIKEIQVMILVDYLRGTRGTNNSYEMLKYLKIKYPKQIEINFFLTPNLKSWKTFLPPRVNEIVGIKKKY